MDNNYLSEKKYKDTKKGINKVGLFSLIIGLIVEFVSIILVILTFINIDKNSSQRTIIMFAIGAFSLLIGFVFARFGSKMLFIGHRREIAAFTTQQVMPVAKEGIEQMSPTIGKAAGEIAKGIKEGLDSANSNNDNNTNNQ